MSPELIGILQIEITTSEDKRRIDRLISRIPGIKNIVWLGNLISSPAEAMYTVEMVMEAINNDPSCEVLGRKQMLSIFPGLHPDELNEWVRRGYIHPTLAPARRAYGMRIYDRQAIEETAEMWLLTRSGLRPRDAASCMRLRETIAS